MMTIAPRTIFPAARSSADAHVGAYQARCQQWQLGCSGARGGHLMKTTLILVLAGALIGAVLASYVVPPALAWYASPGGLPQGAQIQAVVQISEVIRYTTSRLIRGQMIGAAIGAASGLALGLF